MMSGKTSMVRLLDIFLHKRLKLLVVPRSYLPDIKQVILKKGWLDRLWLKNWIPCVTLVSDLEMDEDSVNATCETEEGYTL